MRRRVRTLKRASPTDSRVNRILILAIIAVSLVVAGCPPPERHLLFKCEKKNRKKCKLELLDGKVKLELRSSTDHSVRLAWYGVELGIKVMNRFPGGSVETDPLEIMVLYKDIKMTPPRFRAPFSIDTLDENSLQVWSSYHCTVDTANLATNSRGRPLAVEVTIIFNDFLKYGGVPVFIDTIHAIEPYD